MKERIIGLGLLLCFCARVGAVELLTNGGFEAGSSGWVLAGGALVATNANSHSGASYLAVSTQHGYQTNYQTIQIPTNTQELVLSYYYNIYPADASNAWLGLVLASPSGTWLTNRFAALYNTNADLAPGTYHQQSVDLSAFKTATSNAMQLQLVAYSASSNSGGTTFNLDDLSLLAVQPSEQPANDAFANRIALSGTNIALLASNTFASKEPGEPNHAGGSGGRSVWWSWTAPAAYGTVTITTAGSSFDTLLAVYTGTEVSNLLTVANNNNISSTNPASKVSFNTVPGTQYQIAVDGVNRASGSICLSLAFLPDITLPTISITTPANGARMTNSTLQAMGKASDNIGVAAVQWRLDNTNGTGYYHPADGTNDWSANVGPLVVGTNVLRVMSIDLQGNQSAPRSVTILYVPPDHLSVASTSGGTVTPSYDNKALAMNKRFTLTAVPNNGYLFSNWTDRAGVVITNSPKLAFIMRSNLAFVANFMPNPFRPLQGAYAGLCFQSNGVTHGTSGSFSANVTEAGSFSGKLLMGGTSYSLSGRLGLDGSFQGKLPRKGQSNLVVVLEMDFSGGQLIQGFVEDPGLWRSELTANRSTFSPANMAPEGGAKSLKYTLAISGGSNVLTQPTGYSVGSLTVDVSGNITFAGILADGTKVSQKTFLSQHDQWPFYLSLYGGKGSMLGWLSFTNLSDHSPAGPVSWIKLAGAAKPYPAGFDLSDGLQAAGSLYAATNRMPALTFDAGSPTNGIIVLAGGNLDSEMTNSLWIGSNNKMTGPNQMNLSIAATGLWSGKVFRQVTGQRQTLSVCGAVLQNQHLGVGSFLGNGQSGSARIEPMPSGN